MLSGTVQYGRLEDALGPDERHPVAFEREALSEHCDGEYIAPEFHLACEPGECRQPHEPVAFVRVHALVLHHRRVSEVGQGGRSGLGAGGDRVGVSACLVVPLGPQSGNPAVGTVGTTARCDLPLRTGQRARRCLAASSG